MPEIVELKLRQAPNPISGEVSVTESVDSAWPPLPAWDDVVLDSDEQIERALARGRARAAPAPADPFIIPPNFGPEAPIARVTDAATFLRAYAPISYTIEGVLPSGYLYGITARQGGGKTAFMIAASMAVVLGNETIERGARPRGLCHDRKPNRFQNEARRELLRAWHLI